MSKRWCVAEPKALVVPLNNHLSKPILGDQTFKDSLSLIRHRLRRYFQLSLSPSFVVFTTLTLVRIHRPSFSKVCRFFSEFLKEQLRTSSHFSERSRYQEHKHLSLTPYLTTSRSTTVVVSKLITLRSLS